MSGDGMHWTPDYVDGRIDGIGQAEGYVSGEDTGSLWQHLYAEFVKAIAEKRVDADEVQGMAAALEAASA